jgi:hypothetical protein
MQKSEFMHIIARVHNVSKNARDMMRLTFYLNVTFATAKEAM